MATAAAGEDVRGRYLSSDSTLTVRFNDYWGRWTRAGVHGDPTRATAEKGKVIWEAVLTRLVELVDEFRAWPLAVEFRHQSWLEEEVLNFFKSAVPPLGVLPEVGSFELSGIEMSDGDLLLMLTDGIIEAEDSAGIPFGVRRTLNTVRGSRHLPACEIVETLHKAVAEHCAGKLQDDITSIVVKVLPHPSGRNSG